MLELLLESKLCKFAGIKRVHGKTLRKEFELNKKETAKPTINIKEQQHNSNILFFILILFFLNIQNLLYIF